MEKDGDPSGGWRFAQCFGDKGEVEEITEGKLLEDKQTNRYRGIHQGGGSVLVQAMAHDAREVLFCCRGWHAGPCCVASLLPPSRCTSALIPFRQAADQRSCFSSIIAYLPQPISSRRSSLTIPVTTLLQVTRVVVSSSLSAMTL